MRPAFRQLAIFASLFWVTALFSFTVIAQDGRALYTQLRAFSLTGGKADVTGLVLKVDRGEMTFTGTIYFSAPVEGRVTGAVFVGQGRFRAHVPPDEFEQANAKRLLGVDEWVESDFTSSVLRFSDNSFDTLGKSKTDGAATPEAQVIASQFEARILKETGANISSRIALSLLNHESPGFFFATFDGGKLGRFSLVVDHQNRIPTHTFGINGGEKGLIFKYDPTATENDVWMAFYSLDDYAKGVAAYSDMNDPVNIVNYDMNVDLRQPKTRLGLTTRIDMKSLAKDLSAVTFFVGESLGESENQRLKKQMRLKSATMDSKALEFVQEDWEGGFTVFLPTPIEQGRFFAINLVIEGDFLRQNPHDMTTILFLGVNQPNVAQDFSYPLSNSSWLPRNGYLDRATFSFTYTHPKKFIVASTGTRTSETPDPTNKDLSITKYSMTYPVALATFAVGPFERHTEVIKWENGDAPTPLEFDSPSGDVMAIKEDFILAEMSNSIRFFQDSFGKYPYESFGAVFHPYPFGQGFATLLTIPNADRASRSSYAFISHETAHQWWGNVVSWRSYRDQWLSEGFAEYSGILYTALRDKPRSAAGLIDLMRKSLKDPPETSTGIGKGRLVDVGPLIFGQRLETRRTYGAYSALVYNKGALVLRMLHYLLTDPATGDGKAFFAMMKDFVDRYRNKVASTDDFRIVANEHFARSPIAQKYKLKDLNWFFRQWVYETALPSYRLTYEIQDQPDGSVNVNGTVTQENTPANWVMILPVKITLSGGRIVYSTVAGVGPSAPFSIKLPAKPASIELDPDRWILSDKTVTGK